MKGASCSRTETCFAIVLACVVIALTLLAIRSLPRLPSIRRATFLTYGCDKFAKSKERILKQALATGCFDDARAAVPQDAIRILQKTGATEALKVMQMPRGGGYWLWKPIIIQAALSEMQEGDFLVYADAGCVVHNRPDLVRKDFAAVLHDEVGISHCGTWGGERKRLNRMDVMQAFVGDVDSFLRHTNGTEFEANRLVFCKNQRSVAFVNEWAETAFRNPRWFTDDESTVKNHPDFVEHRHDQSIYNLLAYKHGVLGDKCNVQSWLTADRIRE